MGWKDSSDGKTQDKVDVDLEKGRVTHERVEKTGQSHDHEWSDTRGEGKISYGWRGKNYTEDGSEKKD
jgi:hypothetical protein